MDRMNVINDEAHEERENEFITYFMFLQPEFPEALLREIIQDKEYASPFFLSILQNVIKTNEEIPFEVVGHIYALYGLAAIREKAAYPLLLDLLVQPEEKIDNIIGHVAYDMPAILASVYDENPKPLYELVCNTNACILSRHMAIETLAILFEANKIARHEIVQVFDTLLQTLEHADAPDLLSSLVCSVERLQLHEFFEVSRRLFKQNKIDPDCTTLDEFEESIKTPIRHPQSHLIDDAIVYLRDFYEMWAPDDGSVDKEITFTKEQIDFWQETLDEIVHDSGKIPDTAFNKLVAHPQEACELMLYVLNWAVRAYPNISESYSIHIYAMYFLAQQRDTRAFSPIIELFSLVDDYEEEGRLLDVILDDGAAILASVYDGSLESLIELIEDDLAHDICRVAAIRCLTTLYHMQKIDRKALLQYFSAFCNQFEREQKPDILGILALDSLNTTLHELYDRFKEYFQKNLIDTEIITLKEYEAAQRTIFDGAESIRLIGDVRQEAKSWTWQSKGDSCKNTVGRNDLCLCGSGKKYKKCCLNK